MAVLYSVVTLCPSVECGQVHSVQGHVTHQLHKLVNPVFIDVSRVVRRAGDGGRDCDDLVVGGGGVRPGDNNPFRVGGGGCAVVHVVDSGLDGSDALVEDGRPGLVGREGHGVAEIRPGPVLERRRPAVQICRAGVEPFNEVDFQPPPGPQ